MEPNMHKAIISLSKDVNILKELSPCPIPRDDKLVLVGLFIIGAADEQLVAAADVAGLLLTPTELPPLFRLFWNGRLIWMVVGIVLDTVLLGEDPGLLNPFVRVGVGVVEGEAEKRP